MVIAIVLYVIGVVSFGSLAFASWLYVVDDRAWWQAVAFSLVCGLLWPITLPASVVLCCLEIFKDNEP